MTWSPSERTSESNDPNKEVLVRYHRHSIAEGLCVARVHKRLSRVRRLSDLLGMSFEQARICDQER